MAIKPKNSPIHPPAIAPMGAAGSVHMAAGSVPIPYANIAQNATPTSRQLLTQAAGVQQKQIDYNPKLNPKYNAIATNAAAGSTSMPVDPRACAGQSLVGKDLAAAVSPAGASPSPAGK